VPELIKISGQGGIQSIASLAREIWSEHYTPIIGRGQVKYMLENFQSPAAIEDHLKQGYLYFLVQYRGDEAGYLALVPDRTGNSAQLSKLYIRLGLRGLGLGRAALEQAEKVCTNMGIKELWLTVNKYNYGSIAFYERTGFIRAGTLVQDIGAGFVMDDYKMVKDLTPG